MGRLLVIVGVLLLVVSFIIPLPSLMESITDTLPEAASQAAMRMCAADETLQSDTRVDGNLTYYCVNAENQRRDVTTEVIVGEGGLLSTGMSGLFSYMMAGGVLSVGGIICIIVGVVMMRRSSRPQPVIGVPGGFQQGNAPFGGPSSSTTNFGAHDSGSMMGFVRDQLDDAYRSGKISREDYDRAMEQLNR